MAPTISPKAVLIDLAGVLHTGDEALPGAVRALDRLRMSGLPLRFLTNTTRTPSTILFAKLQRMGFTLAASEIQTAALAARTLVRSRGLRPLWLIHPDIAAEMGENDPEPNVVVLGDMGTHFTYPILNHAFRLLMEGLPLVAMARNRYFMEPDGLSLDMGAFVAGLEYSAGITAEITGKPAPAFFNAALAELGIAPAQAVLIGDDLSDDIGGAQAAGIPGILVRTGKFRAGDDAHPDIRPAAIYDDFSAVVDALLG
ncbi:TIGR01458 family HAD-type hydrolase [Ferribacterium limneticum]|uniref:TIGR01458 family HAD-type hydrolase n=1 Tax=Ferribacterium limneticum TaxID=76259 RepID=UPI001CFC2FA6|nr:TIGR01458 family HAD-type hydrolase [Ferribacterium limneticum]UCV18973.1 TIGR01458 family HAD-type hydrolase [Ferribacterium limneticum]